MKKTFTILSLLITFTIHAQNWSPILSSEKMNYQHSDSAIITNTIWVDSVDIDNNDSLFYLNRIVKDVPDNAEIVLRNQAQFLSKTLIKQEGGIYICTDPSDYLLLTLADLGDTWDFTNSISAEVTNITEEGIFGVQDSVKTISLSDGNEIRLSKNFGIIKFPDFENGGYFELIGIQDTDFGEQVIDFWDIFDFEVGDVFQRYYRESFPNFYDHHITKFLINSKGVFEDHITYSIYSITAGFDCWYGGENNYYSDVYSGDITYSIIDYERTNKFQYELIQLDGYYCAPNYYDDYIFTRILTYPDSLGLISKHWGTFLNTSIFPFPYDGLYYETEPTNDTLTLLYNECFTDGGPHGMNYTQSLGITLNYYNDQYESQDYFYLMGYVKNGDTVGEITPDSVLLTGIGERTVQNPTFSIYPNPCNDILNFKSNSLQEVFPFKLEIRNMQGLIVKETFISENEEQVDISQIAIGIYFYTIKSGNQIMQSGKLVVQ